MTRLWLIRATLLVAAIFLGLGLVAPCMTIQPRFAEYDSWVRLLKPDAARPSSYSVLSGILALIN
ncbi:MAG TPA: hypothetical protein VGB55_09985, partial [Tepidisphaeraceae bacterium]